MKLDNQVVVNWQAHRGGGEFEAPDNTLAANRYTWNLGGIPEADVRSTRDGVILCLHDSTLARTTDAPDDIKDTPISQLDYEQIQPWDAGIRFAKAFAGEKVPLLEDVFKEMKGRPERHVYLDLKELDLKALGELIDRYEVNEQIIFTHKIQDNCIRMKQIAQGVRSMLWIGGTAEQIEQKFDAALASGFNGLDQVQIHLNDDKEQGDWPYQIKPEFLKRALAECGRSGIDLEVLPFHFDNGAIHKLLELGIRWYATDEPARFLAAVKGWTGESVQV